jgi:hypothetical protein
MAGASATGNIVSKMPSNGAPGRIPSNVRLWHKADVPLALTNVCFEGKNGHDAGVPPFRL